MSKPDIFADVHCHSLLKYFHQNKSNVWKSIGTPNFLAHLLGVLRYTCADFRRMALGGVQIAFVVLTPPEQKTFFFKTNLWKKYGKKLSSFLSRIPGESIDFFGSEKYDHYQILKEEMQYYVDKQNQTRKIRFNSYFKRKKCQYKILKNGNEIHQLLTDNARSRRELTVGVVFTVESLHGLGSGHISFNGSENPYNVSEEVLLNRVDAMKGIDSGGEKAWKYSPIWVTPAHGFNNDHFGHAQSLSMLFKKIFDYGEPFDDSRVPPKYVAGINKGMSTTGKKIVARLLGIDQVSENRPEPGKRIHIDVKHMSTRSRQDYYDIVDPYNQAHPDAQIPVVMSHAAVNGKPKLDEQGFNPDDTFEELKSANGLHPWSINLYDDEIIRIHKTKGFIGLVFYEPLLGDEKSLKSTIFWGAAKWAELFGNQIFHIVKTVFKSAGTGSKEEIWNRIGLGTDFDGQLNPTDRFSTATKLPVFKKYLRKTLSDSRFDPYRQKSEVDDLAEKICYENVVEFLNRNF